MSLIDITTRRKMSMIMKGTKSALLGIKFQQENDAPLSPPPRTLKTMSYRTCLKKKDLMGNFVKEVRSEQVKQEENSKSFIHQYFIRPPFLLQLDHRLFIRKLLAQMFELYSKSAILSQWALRRGMNPGFALTQLHLSYMCN